MLPTLKSVPIKHSLDFWLICAKSNYIGSSLSSSLFVNHFIIAAFQSLLLQRQGVHVQCPHPQATSIITDNKCKWLARDGVPPNTVGCGTDEIVYTLERVSAEFMHSRSGKKFQFFVFPPAVFVFHF